MTQFQHTWNPCQMQGFFTSPNFVSHRPRYTICSDWWSLVVVRYNLISFEIFVQSEEGKEIWPDPPDCRFSAKETDKIRKKTIGMPDDEILRQILRSLRLRKSVKFCFSDKLSSKSLKMYFEKSTFFSYKKKDFSVRIEQCNKCTSHFDRIWVQTSENGLMCHKK